MILVSPRKCTERCVNAGKLSLFQLRKIRAQIISLMYSLNAGAGNQCILFTN